MFTNKTSLIVPGSKPSEFIKDTDIIFTKLKNWFKANLLSLSFEKKRTRFMQFLTKITSNIDLNIGYDKRIPNNTYSKFLGIMTDNTLTWKTYIEMKTPK